MLENLKPSDDQRLRCKVRATLNSLEPNDREHLERYLADDETWSAHQLSNALRKQEIFISTNVILRHRKGNCSC